jgi:hypothetical protein
MFYAVGQTHVNFLNQLKQHSCKYRIGFIRLVFLLNVSAAKA